MPNNLNKKNVRSNGFMKRMSNRASRLSSKVRNMGKNLGNKLQGKSRKNNGRNRSNGRHRSNGIKHGSNGRNRRNHGRNRSNGRHRSNGRNRRNHGSNGSNGRNRRNHGSNGSNGRNRRNHGSNGRNGRNHGRNHGRNMRGGAIEYSPLPCDANGNTSWDSTQQVGHETCVEYGTQGAENDARASGLGAGKLSSLDITQTIKDAVDQQLKNLSSTMVGEDAATVRQAMQARATGLGGTQGQTGVVQGAMDNEASRQAYQISQDRQAAQAAANQAPEQAA
jgi:hypothetical protein